MFGGKSKGLELLKDAGLPVPEFIVLENSEIPGILNDRAKLLTARIQDAFGDSNLAVRSSADVEDGKVDSFAGVFKSVLDVPIESDKITDAVRQVYESAKNAETMGKTDAKMNIVIQKFINPVIAGVCFTNVYNERGAEECLTSFVRGLGEQLVGGTTKSFDIYLPWRDGKIQMDSFRFTGPDKLEYLNFIYSLISQIQKICDVIYNFADIEWAIDADGKVWILQLRPITKNILLGQHNFSFSILSAGKASGKVTIIPQVAYGDGWLERVKPYIDNFPDGGIMATEWTDTYFLSAMNKARAIIVRTGSLMSHSAIISREKNIPCVLVGEKIWNKITDGADIEIDTYAQTIKINGKLFGTDESGAKDLLSDLYLFDNVYELYGKKYTHWLDQTDNGPVLHYNMQDMDATNDIDEFDIFVRKTFGAAPKRTQDKYFYYFMVRRWKMMPIFSKFYNNMREYIKTLSVDRVRGFYEETLTTVKELHARRETADALEKIYLTEEILGLNNLRDYMFPDYCVRYIYKYLFGYLHNWDISFDDFIKDDFQSDNAALMRIHDCFMQITESRNAAYSQLLKTGAIGLNEWVKLDAAVFEYFGVENKPGTIGRYNEILSCKLYPKLFTGRDEIWDELHYNAVGADK